MDDRIFAETVLYGPFNLSTYKHWRVVLTSFEQQLRAKGYKQYWATVDSPERFRWCEFLGFRPGGEILGPHIEFMVKDI